MKLVTPKKTTENGSVQMKVSPQAVSDDPPISYVDEFSNSDLIDDKLFRNDKDFNVLIYKLEVSHLRIRRP